MINRETDRVLITGAAGAIGTALRAGLRKNWRHLRLTDIRPVQDLANTEESIVTDSADRPAVEAMMRPIPARRKIDLLGEGRRAGILLICAQPPLQPCAHTSRRYRRSVSHARVPEHPVR